MTPETKEKLRSLITELYAEARSSNCGGIYNGAFGFDFSLGYRMERLEKIKDEIELILEKQ